MSRQGLCGANLTSAILAGAALDCETLEGALLCDTDLTNAKVAEQSSALALYRPYSKQMQAKLTRLTETRKENTRSLQVFRP